MILHQHPSPNCGLRRDGLRPTHVVLHYTAMATAEAAIERLCDPAAEVSAHYVICKTGRVTQLVPEGLRAWHAGVGEWDGLQDINSRSIGIELDNDGQGPFAQPLMQSLEVLLASILAGWAILPENVIGHSDMAPGRKFDPGPFFDWARLEARGLAARRVVGTSSSGMGNDAFRHLARAAGYAADVSDDALLAAVRLRHRPDATGPLGPEDFAALTCRTPVCT
ncbi:N-acetylmuramoyl-L-alanine amidase [Tateyamaria sp. ANG-S1]|nr:N-acetylmuramoyl-L-alanine amidase [Tateyamaria sp. ANG-S1]